MDWRIRLPGGLYRQAATKAGGDAQLAQRVRVWLERYAADERQQAGAKGGTTRAARMTPEALSDAARKAALARWSTSTAE